MPRRNVEIPRLNEERMITTLFYVFVSALQIAVRSEWDRRQRRLLLGLRSGSANVIIGLAITLWSASRAYRPSTVEVVQLPLVIRRSCFAASVPSRSARAPFRVLSGAYFDFLRMMVFLVGASAVDPDTIASGISELVGTRGPPAWGWPRLARPSLPPSTTGGCYRRRCTPQPTYCQYACE